MARFSVEPRGQFVLAQANTYFGGWATLSGDPNALVMAFPVEGWRTSAAVVVHQEPSGLVVEVSDDEVTAQAVQHAYELTSAPNRAAIEKLAEPWRPYRGWAKGLLN